MWINIDNVRLKKLLKEKVGESEFITVKFDGESYGKAEIGVLEKRLSNKSLGAFTGACWGAYMLCKTITTLGVGGIMGAISGAVQCAAPTALIAADREGILNKFKEMAGVGEIGEKKLIIAFGVVPMAVSISARIFLVGDAVSRLNTLKNVINKNKIGGLDRVLFIGKKKKAIADEASKFLRGVMGGGWDELKEVAGDDWEKLAISLVKKVPEGEEGVVVLEAMGEIVK